MAFVAVNVTVSHSYQGEKGVAQFTLLDLVANADGGTECVADDPGECAVGCFGHFGPCCVGYSPNCSDNGSTITCDDDTLQCPG